MRVQATRNLSSCTCTRPDTPHEHRVSNAQIERLATKCTTTSAPAVLRRIMPLVHLHTVRLEQQIVPTNESRAVPSYASAPQFAACSQAFRFNRGASTILGFPNAGSQCTRSTNSIQGFSQLLRLAERTSIATLLALWLKFASETIRPHETARGMSDRHTNLLHPLSAPNSACATTSSLLLPLAQ